MNRERERAIEVDCQKLVTRMGYDLDEGNFDGFVEGFTEDGIWERRGEQLRGREQILAVLRLRSDTLRIRHVLTNFLVNVISDDEIHCQCYMSGRRTDTGARTPGPVPASDCALWIYHDLIVCTERGWKVKHRRSERVFENTMQEQLPGGQVVL